MEPDLAARSTSVVWMERREVLRLLPIVLELTDDTGHALAIRLWFWAGLAGLLGRPGAAHLLFRQAAGPGSARRLDTLLS
jgi:hypothetical protein